MKTTSTLGLVIVLLGVAVLVVTYIRDELKSRDQAKKFKEVTDGQNEIKEDTKGIGDINAKLDLLIENAEKDNPDVISWARQRYPFGFAVFGYENGESTFKPYESDSSFKVATDWGATTMRTDVPDDAVIFMFNKVHLTDGVWQVVLQQYEHTHHPLYLDGSARVAVSQTPSGYLVLEMTGIPVKTKPQMIYLVGFRLEKELESPVATDNVINEIKDFTFTPNPPKK